MFYFTISPYLKDNNDKNYLILNDLNEKIIKLAEDINDINVIFLQKINLTQITKNLMQLLRNKMKKKLAYKANQIR